MSGDASSLLREKAPIVRTLEDGLSVLLRPIEKTDLDRVHLAYELLSEESRMNRFWEKPRELSPSRALSLTNAEALDHVAWIALNPFDDTFPGYAGGSFWRDRDNRTRAELAFTVADTWQRRGLATLLFSILWFDGWRSGVRQFYGSCRLNNVAMAEWWEGMGGRVEKADRDYRLALDLISPEVFFNKVAYGIPSSYRQIEVAGWMRQWLELVD